MSRPETEPRNSLRHLVEVALLFGVAVGLLVLGVGNLVDTITWTLPGWANLIVGVGLLLYAFFMVRQD